LIKNLTNVNKLSHIRNVKRVEVETLRNAQFGGSKKAAAICSCKIKKAFAGIGKSFWSPY
jgi:hypothetical protein